MVTRTEGAGAVGRGARLHDRVVVVTGAAGGMGCGIGQALLEEGARVVLTDLDEQATGAARVELDPEGSRTLAVAADVRDVEALEDVAARAIQAFGQLDGWVNNAAVIELGPMLTLARSGRLNEFDVNYHAVVEGCLVAARHMIAQGGGSIVNIASNAGKVGFPNMVGYNSSKAAVINLTRGLAQEWAGDGINVNAVCPGSVNTNMLGAVADAIVANTGADREAVLDGMKAEQLGRHTEPIEVGRIAAFLLSDDAVIIRGQSINVDAGGTPY